MTPITTSWQGVVLATMFVIAMVVLFWWMFKVPPAVPMGVVNARRSVTGLHRILVAVVETVASERAVELACRLGHEQKAEIIVAYVMEVPMSLPLQTPLPNLEAKGRQALDTAKFIINQHNLPAKMRIMPQRTAADGILRIAREEQVDVIVMGLGERRQPIPSPLGQTVWDVLRKAPCEVILDKVPGHQGS